MKKKQHKKTFKIPVGVIIILVLAIIFVISYIKKINSNTTNLKETYTTTNNFSYNSQLQSVDKNENYKNRKKLSIKDLKLGDIYCGMKLKKMISVLGECNNIYDGQGAEYQDLNYKCYRYEDYNLLVDIDANSEIVKRINYYGNDFETKRKIKIGTPISDVIKAYHSERNIGVYSSNYRTYKVLYNSDDTFDYIYNESTEDKSLGYIYEYDGEVYTIKYIEDNAILTFDILNNQVSHIEMSCK